MPDHVLRDDWAAAFATAVADPDRPAPPWLRDPAGAVAARRFAIYRNNVALGLIEALAANFPVLERLLGAEAFREMARAFVRAHPPGSRILHEYGADLAGFLADFEPFRALPYLPDVARVERAWLDAFHAPDARILDGAALAAVAPDELPSLRLASHPAARMIRSTFPVGTIWEANRPGRSPGQIDGSRAEIVLITRPGEAVELRVLSPADAAFIRSMMAGDTLLDAVSAAAGTSVDFDLPAALQMAIGSGVF